MPVGVKGSGAVHNSQNSCVGQVYEVTFPGRRDGNIHRKIKA